MSFEFSYYAIMCKGFSFVYYATRKKDSLTPIISRSWRHCEFLWNWKPFAFANFHFSSPLCFRHLLQKIVKPWPVATQWLSGRKKLVSRWSIDQCFGWSYFFSVVFARKTDVLELCFALDFLRLCFQMWKTFDYWQLWRIWTFENTGNFRNTQKLQKIDIVRYSEILL